MSLVRKQVAIANASPAQAQVHLRLFRTCSSNAGVARECMSPVTGNNPTDVILFGTDCRRASYIPEVATAMRDIDE